MALSVAGARRLEAQTNNPPVVQITSTSSDTQYMQYFNISFCDDHGLNSGSQKVLWNGADVTSNFPYTTGTGGSPYCMYQGSSTGMVYARLGLDTLSVTMCESLYSGSFATPLCTTSTKVIRFRDIDVTPANGAATRAANRTGQYVDFTAQQISGYIPGPMAQYNVIVTCSGNITSCSGPTSLSGSTAPQTIRVTFNTGAQGTSGIVTVRVEGVGNVEDRAIAAITVTNDYPQVLQVSTAQNNNDNQIAGACAVSCFAATASASTAPYISMDSPRSVTAVYNGDHVGARAFVYADVSLGAFADPVSTFTLEVKSAAGARIPFTNGDDILTFGPGASATDAVRLAGQLNLNGQTGGSSATQGATGLYPVSIVVTAKYQDGHLESKTIPTKIMVVNNQSSAVGRGWTIAGVARLYEQVATDTSVLITEGDGSAVYYARNGSSYTDPPGEFRRLTVSGTGSSRQWVRAYADSTKETFNWLGLLTKVTDRFGNAVDFDYDGSLNLVKIYDPIRMNGASRMYTELFYNSFGLTRIEEFRSNGFSYGGRSTYFTADASGIRSVQDASGTTSFGYDGSGRLSTITDQRGITSTFLYGSDPSWKITGVRSPTVTIDDVNGTPQDVMLVTGYQPWQTVGVPFTPTTAAAPASPVKVAAVAAVVTDPAGHQTRMTVNSWGQPLTVTDAVGNVAKTEYNTNGQPTVIWTPTGAVTQYGYSGPFVTSVTPPGQGSTYFTYGAWGQLKQQYGAGPTIDYYTTDTARGRLDSTKVGGQFKTTFSYDSRGRLLTTTDPKGHTTTYTYETVFGNRDSVRTANGLGSKTKFDRFGRDSTVASAGRATSTTIYDDVNRVIKVYDGVNPNPTTIAYDLDQPARVVDPKGQLFKTEYNALGWPKKVYDSRDTTIAVAATYTADGLVASRTNREGRRVDMRYDAIHRMISQSDPLADSLSFGYDAPGLRVVGKSFDRGRVLVAMDSSFTRAAGWTDSVVTWLNGQRFRRYYHMDAATRLDSLTIASSSNIDFYARRWFFNTTTGVLDSLRVGANRIRYHYDADGLPDTTNWAAGGVTRQQSWTTDHQPDVTTFSASAFDNAFRRDLDYDNQGRVSLDTRRSNNGNTLQHRSYGYDGIGELQRAYRDSVAWVNQCINTNTPPYYSCSNVQKTFVLQKLGLMYDAASNMRQQVDSTSMVTSVDTIYTGNRLRYQLGTTYAYDRDGNMTLRSNSSGTTLFGWDASGQLRWAAKGSDTTFFDYDAAGQLVRRRKAGGVVDRWLLWDQGQILAELNSAASDRAMEYAYAGGTDQPVARIYGSTGSSTLEWYQQSVTGNVEGLLNASGIYVNQTLSYDNWGVTESVSGTPVSSLRWKGMYYDVAPADLYYARARWYDPQARRFISEDPIGLDGGINQYIFGGNDPINYSDPSGMDQVMGEIWVWANGYVPPQCSNLNISAQMIYNCPMTPSQQQQYFYATNQLYAMQQSHPNTPSATPGSPETKPLSPACWGAIGLAGLQIALDASTVIGIGAGIRGVWAGGKMIASGLAARAAAQEAGNVAFGAAARIEAGAATRAAGWASIRSLGGNYPKQIVLGSTEALLGTQSKWELVGRFVPGVASGLAVRDAMRTCSK